MVFKHSNLIDILNGSELIKSLSFQIKFDMQPIQSRIQRNSSLNVLCSSSEIVRIWNYHAINNLNPTECIPGIFGFQGSKLMDYFDDYFLSPVIPDRALHKQFLGMHKIISKDIPNYGGTPKLLNMMLTLVITLKMPIPIKALWTESKQYDFHYYCAYKFWPAVWQSIDTSLQQKRNHFGYNVHVNKKSEQMRTCEELNCEQKFGSFSAAKRHRMKKHRENAPSWTSQFPDLEDSESDSEEEKWISFRCQKCYELFLTKETYRNHLTFHNEHEENLKLCQAKFEEKISKVPPEIASQIIPEKIANCKLCSKRFQTENYLWIHTKKYHPEVISGKDQKQETVWKPHKKSEDILIQKEKSNIDQ